MVTILANDYYVGYYDATGKRIAQGSDLSAETLLRSNPGAACYLVPQEVYDDLYDGEGYPATTAALPFNRFRKLA